MSQLTAGQLSELLGVRRETISHWHKRRIIVGQRSSADKRLVLFDIAEVRAAILKHNLCVLQTIFEL